MNYPGYPVVGAATHVSLAGACEMLSLTVELSHTYTCSAWSVRDTSGAFLGTIKFDHGVFEESGTDVGPKEHEATIRRLTSVANRLFRRNTSGR